MSTIHKLIKYAIEEVRMAEEYIKLANKVEDPSIAAKLQEIAKDELRHCEYDQSAAMKLIEKEKAKSDEDDEKSVEDSVNHAFLDVYTHWKDKVKYMVDTFEIKR